MATSIHVTAVPSSAVSDEPRPRHAQRVTVVALMRLAAASAVIATAVLAAGAALVACNFSSPASELPGGEPVCNADADCAQAGKAVCDLSVPEAAVCVQCTPEKPGACTGATPVCGADSKACRGCSAHAECSDSAVCEQSGSCTDPAKVLYATPTGAGSVCSKNLPCSLSEALGKVTPAQSLIKLSGGTFVLNISLNGDLRNLKDFTITVVAEPGTKLQPITPGAPALHLSRGAKMSLFDVELGGSTDDTVRLDLGAALTLTRGKVVGGAGGALLRDSVLTLRKSEFSGGVAHGIQVEGELSRVTMEQSRIVGSQGEGLRVFAGELVLSRSLVRGNRGGGVVVLNQESKITITNSFIVENMGLGGISAPRISSDSQIDFNTIVDNFGGTSLTSAGGVVCDSAGFNLTGNIVFRNSGGTGGLVQEFGACTYTGSLVLPGNAPIEEHPKFISLTDYHLSYDALATVRNVAGVTCSGVDYDGDPRPQGGGCELGADELPQP